MRRADALWQFTASTLTDVTTTLGGGSAPIMLAPGDKLYVGQREWLSGLVCLINTFPVSRPEIVVEMFDAGSNAWQPLALQERIDQLGIGHAIDPSGYTFQISGLAYWGVAPYRWTLKKAGSSFPEATSAPAVVELFWVRLRNTGAIPVQIDRVLPSLFNTYATHQDVAHFMGMAEFSDLYDPLQTFVRERIRAAEDWLDSFSRRAWRPRMAQNERVDFNLFGMRLKNTPVWFVTRLGVWVGDSFTQMFEGRGQDFYVENRLGMIYFTRAQTRGALFGRYTGRYSRQQAACEIDYLYGDDFDISEHRAQVQDIVLMRVGYDLVMQGDYTSVLVNNDSAVSKSEKATQWREQAEERAELLRSTWIV